MGMAPLHKLHSLSSQYLHCNQSQSLAGCAVVSVPPFGGPTGGGFPTQPASLDNAFKQEPEEAAALQHLLRSESPPWLWGLSYFCRMNHSSFLIPHSSSRGNRATPPSLTVQHSPHSHQFNQFHHAQKYLHIRFVGNKQIRSPRAPKLSLLLEHRRSSAPDAPKEALCTWQVPATDSMGTTVGIKCAAVHDLCNSSSLWGLEAKILDGLKTKRSLKRKSQ